MILIGIPTTLTMTSTVQISRTISLPGRSVFSARAAFVEAASSKRIHHTLVGEHSGLAFRFWSCMSGFWGLGCMYTGFKT